MTQRKLQQIFFLVFLNLIGGLAFFMFLPFFGTVVLAATFAVVLHPVHKKLTIALRGKEAIASLITMLLGAIIVLGPVTLFGLRIFQETADLYTELSLGQSWIAHMANDVVIKEIHHLLPNVHIDVNDILKQAVAWVASNVGTVFTGTIGSLVHVFVFVITLYFILKDGLKFKQTLIHFSPLPDEYDFEIYIRLTKAMRSILMGSLLVALIQGIISGIGFSLFNIPNATLWGGVAAICSLIPGVGTSIVLIPAILYVYTTSEPAMAVGLAFWSLTMVGLIDNILNPFLIGRGVRIHPFFVFMSVISGIAFFGPVGFVFGPLLLSLLFALLDIYRMFILKEKSKRSLT